MSDRGTTTAKGTTLRVAVRGPQGANTEGVRMKETEPTPLTAEELVYMRDAAEDSLLGAGGWATPEMLRRLLATLDAERAATEALRHWLLHPDRSYTPHELAMEAVRRIDALGQQEPGS